MNTLEEEIKPGITGENEIRMGVIKKSHGVGLIYRKMSKSEMCFGVDLRM